MESCISCMNCGKAVSEKSSKIFAEVFVCADCYQLADRLYRKCEGELKRLLLLLKEAVRVALVEGKLKYGQASDAEVPKEELLKMIVQLSEKNSETTPR